VLNFADEALVLVSQPHGEHGAVVKFLSFEGGLRRGYVPGARGKGRRALLSPGNRVALVLKARTEGQLAGATLELVESRALLAFQAASAAMLAWTTELTGSALAEAVPHRRLADALDALLGGLAAGMDAVAARAALARYELLLLEEEGFGLDLSACALGGDAADLGFVSPKTGRAVSRAKAAGQPWEDQLLALPRFLIAGGAATDAEADTALALTGHFLARHWLAGDRLPALRARAIGSTRVAP
jgi:DNA repair protein RecO (recombination protein O)